MSLPNKKRERERTRRKSTARMAGRQRPGTPDGGVANAGEPVAIFGYYEKRARKSARNWKRRWFRFEINDREGTANISYWKNESACMASGPPSGTVTMKSNGTVTAVPARDHCLEFLDGSASASPLLVSCDSSAGQKQLLLAFQRYVHATTTGYLMKRARKSGRNWKKRWMVLDFEEPCLLFSTPRMTSLR